MPKWTNFHNKEAFIALSDKMRREAQWDSTDLILLELLARFTKSVKITAKVFFGAVPEKFLANLLPNERFAKVLAFFEKMAAAGLCEVIHRADELNHIEVVELTEPETNAERNRKAAIDPALKHLRHFYARRDFKKLLANQHAHLPSPETLESHTPLSKALLANFHSQKVTSLLFSNKEVPNPEPRFTQEVFAACDQPFMVVEFPSLTAFDQSKKPAGNKEEGVPELPFAVVLPADTVLKDLIKDFYVPLVLGYLQEEKNKDVYKTIHHEWSKKIHTSLSDSQLDPDARIERTLLNADLSDGAYYASVHVLTHVLRHLRLRNLPSAPSPMVYEATRFIYDYAIACRQTINIEKQRKAELVRDQELILAWLLKENYTTPPGSRIAGPLPAETKQIEGLTDCAGKTTLSLKYGSVKNLVPVEPTNLEQVPRVLQADGCYIHRWQLVNYFVLMQHLESSLVRRKLAAWWAESGMPRQGAMEVPERLVSQEFMKAALLVHEYRSGAKIALEDKQIGRELDVFVHYFFPSKEQAIANKVEGLLKAVSDAEDESRGPKAIVRDTVDRILYRDLRSFALQPYSKMLYLDYAAIRQETLATVRARRGWFGYMVFMLKSMFGVQAGSPPKAEPVAARTAAPSRSAAAPSPRPAPAPLDQKTIQELEEVTAKIPRVLRVDMRSLQDLVDSTVRSLNPDIRNLGDEDARAFVKTFIAKAPRLNALPYRADPIFVRYVLLLMRKNNARN
jgi:hypothetical protein